MKVHVDKFRANQDDKNAKSLVFKMLVNVCKKVVNERIDIETMKVWQVHGEFM